MQLKSHRLLALAAMAGLSAALAAPGALAQTPPPGSSPPGSTSPQPGSSGMEPGAGASAEFTKLDTDKDGLVSKKEATKNKQLTSKWDTLDTNKDGKLDQGEFAAYETSSPSGSPPPSKY